MYAARLSHLKIVAEIMDRDTSYFWRMPPEKQQLVFKTFAGTGARLLLAPDPSPALRVDPPWIAIPGVPYYARWLPSAN